MIIIVQTWILLSYLKGVSWAFLFIEDVDLCQNQNEMESSRIDIRERFTICDKSFY
jgi:hypothetical protein